MSAMPAQSPPSLAVRRCAAPPEPELTTPVRSVAAEFARGDPIIELQIDEVPEHLAEFPPDNAAEIEWARIRFGRVLQAIDRGDGALAESLTHERLLDMIKHHRRVVTRAVPLRMIV
jgi:HAMP domain-containing protein